MIILVVFAAKIIRRVETCEKVTKIANHCLLLLPTAKYNRDLRTHKIKRITTVKRAMTVSCTIKQELFFLSIKSPWDIERFLFKFELGLSDYNRTRTHNHLVRKRTLNHLAKLELGCSDKIRSYDGLLPI